MTVQEIEEVLTQVAGAQVETQRELREIARLMAEQQAKDAERRSREAEQRSREAEQRSREAEQRAREAEQDAEQRQNADRRAKEMDRYLKELGAQIGGLGEKFGSFTEGMAFPSMHRILEQRFHMDVIGTRMIGRNNGHSMELDVLAYSNRGRAEVYIVEVKSHLREEGLQRMLQILCDFHQFFPGHKGKKVYGILACVDAPDSVARHVVESGVYLARIHDGHFEIKVPEGFQPQPF